MKSRLLLVLAIFTQLVLAARGGAVQTAPPAEEGSLKGSVRDTSPNGFLPGVKVSAINIATNLHRETTTTASGEFSLTNLPRGIYRIHAESPGFATVIRVEPIEPGPATLNLFLPVAPIRDGLADVGVLSGTVRGFDNVSLVGVRITIRNGTTGKTQQIQGDARGNYSVSDLAAGVFEILAEREGFQTLRLTDIRLTGKFTAQLHLKLQPVSGQAAPAATH
jgi:hypothetical protein